MCASPNSERRALLTRVLSWPSHQLFLVCFLIGGVILCSGSFALHIYDLEAPAGSPFGGPRQIGYLWAPNWSLTYAILGPLALFLMLEALKGIREALDYLFETEMVRDESMKPVHERLSGRAWEDGIRIRNWFLLIFAGLVPALLSYGEWYPHNLKRLITGTCHNCEPSDYDWGLAAIIKGSGGAPNWLANSVFDFLAFTCEGLFIGAAVLCFLYLLDLDHGPSKS